ncbi:MAG: hypothetical protein JWQ71_2126 [Pedosphaera sp.]|nr:hypothetical protein [Pedosphaera sp.]
MIKSLGKLSLVGILAATVLGMPVRVSAEDAKKPAPAAPAAPKNSAIPFHGKLGAVDKSAKTITLDEKTKRTFQITSETKINKDGKPATLDDAVVGDVLGGRYKKGDDGKLTVVSLRLGEKPEATVKKKTETTK